MEENHIVILNPIARIPEPRVQFLRSLLDLCEEPHLHLRNPSAHRLPVQECPHKAAG
jgi:hypothetical protein